MTITTRSKRVSLFDSTPTPSAVGPGAYAPEKTVTSFRSESRPLYSGFAASEKRDLNANKTTSAITPGPGAYISSVGQSDSPVVSNAFATKISRFAPSAPGSTIYRPSTIQDNPGPGAYAVDTPQPHRPKSSPRHATTSNQLHHEPRTTVPTIPTRAQSFGYTKDPRNGELKPQPQPAAVYSGIGQDTVGPAAYSSHAATLWDDRKNVAPSIKSTVKRDVWEQVTTPRRAVPGPGQYEPDPNPTRRHGSNPSAVFASRVPLLPDPKRPDQYDPERDQELLAKDQRHQPAKARGHKVEAFGSTSQRTDLAHQLSAPFSSPTYTATPGPGMYAGRSPSQFFRAGGTIKKATTHHSTRYRAGHHIGFTSATERDCLRHAKPSALPGPGSYRSETPRTVERAVQSKSTVGRFGVFGSTSERRVWEGLETAEPDDLTPGPGAYDPSINTGINTGITTTTGSNNTHANSAAFKSASSRFARHANPHVHCVGDTNTPAVGQYNLQERDGYPISVDAGLASPRAPFLSTAERSVFDAKDARLVPGPGQYDDSGEEAHDPHARTRSRGVRATLSNEQRFRVRPRVPDHVGPGAYTIHGTVGTKSFNVTMAPKR